MIAGSPCIVMADLLLRRYHQQMSAQITDRVLVLIIDETRELNVINDSKGRRVKFVLKDKHSDASQTREEWYLSARDAMRLSMYVAGIRDAMRIMDDFEDEPTLDDTPKKKARSEWHEPK